MSPSMSQCRLFSTDTADTAHCAQSFALSESSCLNSFDYTMQILTCLYPSVPLNNNRNTTSYTVRLLFHQFLYLTLHTWINLSLLYRCLTRLEILSYLFQAPIQPIQLLLSSISKSLSLHLQDTLGVIL